MPTRPAHPTDGACRVLSALGALARPPLRHPIPETGCCGWEGGEWYQAIGCNAADDGVGGNSMGEKRGKGDRVTAVWLRGAGLTGEMPREWWEGLEMIDLAHNRLTGMLPHLPETLTQAWLEGNELTGALYGPLEKACERLECDLRGNLCVVAPPGMADNLTERVIGNQTGCDAKADIGRGDDGVNTDDTGVKLGMDAAKADRTVTVQIAGIKIVEGWDAAELAGLVIALVVALALVVVAAVVVRNKRRADASRMAGVMMGYDRPADAGYERVPELVFDD
ncbi:hypothetical protein HK101_004668 [Irineochytrium annulatum]|nr:hypothetical protein HK101_004668 [Irineochytrium annulatum]